jgi:uridine kinase
MHIIGIAGGSGSGKSTLVEHITALFPLNMICHVPMDAYYKDHSYLSILEKKKHNFDLPDAIDFGLLTLHIQQLKLGIAIERPLYSFISCSRLKESILVKPGKILIIDGIHALSNKEVRDLLDLKIFLSVSEQNRLMRIIARDTIDRGRTKTMVEKRFYETVKPMHDIYVEPFKNTANIFIDGDKDNFQMIVNHLEMIIQNCLAREHQPTDQPDQ